VAKVTITNYIDVMDGDGGSGLLLKLFTSATTAVSKFMFVGANGEKAFGKLASLNEARYMVIGAGTFGSTAGAGDALAVTKYCEVEIGTALNVGTKLYLANTTAGAAGEIVTDTTATVGDLLQEVGVVVNDKNAGATSKIAIIDIRKADLVSA
jgi:hypothetical protein